MLKLDNKENYIFTILRPSDKVRVVAVYMEIASYPKVIYLPDQVGAVHCHNMKLVRLCLHVQGLRGS
jgi:hypothetical protein